MRALLPIILLCLSLGATAQPPSWRWAAHGYNTQSALTSKVATDAAGNVCAAGLFNGTLRLGDSIYRANGTQDVFVAAYDRDSRLRWSHALGDGGSTGATSVVMDRETSEVYLAGTFQTSITIGDSTYASQGANDIFLIKYSKDGKLLWARTFGSLHDDVVYMMSMDSKHHLILGGDFSSAQSVQDTILFGSFRLPGHGNPDPFLVKLDSAGTVIWAKNPGDKSSEHGLNVAVDLHDNVFFCGMFGNRIYFDTLVIRGVSVSNFGSNGFIAKYDSSGNVLWAKPYGGVGKGGTGFEDMFPGHCAVDAAGNLFLGGYFTGGRLIPDPDNQAWTITDGGQWLAKYGPGGSIIWAKKIGPSGYMNAMTCDPEGNLYLAGEYGPGSRFDTTYPYIPAGSLVGYAYVARFDGTTSALRWIQTAGDESGAVAFDIAANGPDEVAVCGQFYHGPSIQFGNTTCYNTGTQGNGFVARLRPDAAGVPNTSAAEVQIYPNPARTELHIVLASAAYDRYRLINALGQRVAEGALKHTEQMIRLPQLAAGVYYLELASSEHVIRRSVVIH